MVIHKTFLVCVVALLASTAAKANQRTTIFNGFGVSIDQIRDVMTDENKCAMFVQAGPIYLSINGPSKIVVWASTDELNFAFDASHLIRIGEDNPLQLTYLSKRNGLALPSAKVSEHLVEALAKGKAVYIRYVDWPEHDSHDVKIESPAFAYAWGIAAEKCGWHKLDVPSVLAPAELRIYEPTDPASKGYATASVIGNDDIGLSKGFDKYGGGCQIKVGVHGILGMFKGHWATETASLLGSGKLTVFDKDGKTTFEAKFPDGYGGIGGVPWGPAESAARAMWEASPNGTISVTDVTYDKQRVPLYGFRKLWQWGQNNCGFPALDTSLANPQSN